jgi:hypothetical protein
MAEAAGETSLKSWEHDALLLVGTHFARDTGGSGAFTKQTGSSTMAPESRDGVLDELGKERAGGDDLGAT